VKLATHVWFGRVGQRVNPVRHGHSYSRATHRLSSQQRWLKAAGQTDTHLPRSDTHVVVFGHRYGAVCGHGQSAAFATQLWSRQRTMPASHCTSQRVALVTQLPFAHRVSPGRQEQYIWFRTQELSQHWNMSDEHCRHWLSSVAHVRVCLQKYLSVAGHMLMHWSSIDWQRASGQSAPLYDEHDGATHQPRVVTSPAAVVVVAVAFAACHMHGGLFRHATSSVSARHVNVVVSAAWPLASVVDPPVAVEEEPLDVPLLVVPLLVPVFVPVAVESKGEQTNLPETVAAWQRPRGHDSAVQKVSHGQYGRVRSTHCEFHNAQPTDVEFGQPLHADVVASMLSHAGFTQNLPKTYRQ
jgi:hypothetical protein